LNKTELIKNHFDLRIEILESITENLIPINLEPGEKLCDFNQDFPGIFFIIKGKLRLLDKSNSDEIFTIKTISEGEYIGAIQLLRGVLDQAVAASNNVSGFLFPANKFIRLILKEKDFLNSFSLVDSIEFYSSLRNNRDFQQFDPKTLLYWSKKELSNSIRILNSYPGENYLNQSKENWIISSCNIKDLSPGQFLNSPMQYKVEGSIPARLIPISLELQKKINYLKEKFSINMYKERYQKGNSENDFRIPQLEALEDWYGRLNKNNNYPHTSGIGLLDETLACLRMLSQFYDLPFRKDLLRKVISAQIKLNKNKRIGIHQLAAIIEFLGLRSSLLSPKEKDLTKRLPCPCLIFMHDRPIVIWQQSGSKSFISDPLEGKKWLNNEEIFNARKKQDLKVLFIERTSFSPKARFGLKWFLPSLYKHRFSLIQVLVASFFAQLLGLFNPLLIQQIIDATINQGNITSLNILGVLLIIMAIAQALISSLRTYLFADTTNRIDISLGSTIIHHLLRLPLNYFSSRPVGEVSNRINELEKIRGFLTGTALTAFLDATFSIIYIGVMLVYSVKLTFFSLAVLPFFILLSYFISPIIKKQLRNKAIASAHVNSHLVETLSGMETIKGQGMEIHSEWRWEKFYERQIKEGFRNTIVSTSAGAASNFLQQVSGLIVIWVGATLVLDGQMTVGQLIAFRILSGYVTGPMLRIVSLWQNFQETIISLERLSDIVDQKEEIEVAGQNLPPLPLIKGKVNYINLNYRFGDSGSPQLSNINFEIQPGEFVGIVGSSGSGKSTLLKMLTRFFEPKGGSIEIDNQDISKVDLYSLRTQLGVVPQDSLLFDGSIQENISLTRPEASFEEIQTAAKIACAHSFIQDLSSGYSTKVGERGSNLSGGQRQRIAIARMVLKKPRMLILDEATSSLDFDTEYQVTNALANHFKNKTVFFITHRLTSLIHADKILFLNKGILVEQGTHEELIKINGRYATLFKQQKSGLK
tara:strand:+ start:878 stop:3832 length:2955 start_codon:yes stop_codon:yes gene_type:complete